MKCEDESELRGKKAIINQKPDNVRDSYELKLSSWVSYNRRYLELNSSMKTSTIKYISQGRVHVQLGGH